jgi:hypothetical protein
VAEVGCRCVVFAGRMYIDASLTGTERNDSR